MLQDGMRRSELGLWAALYAIDPWGEQRADRRAAIGHALFANANRNREMRAHPYSVEEFMPYIQRSPEEMREFFSEALLQTLAATAGGGRKAWDKSEHSRRRRAMKGK